MTIKAVPSRFCPRILQMTLLASALFWSPCLFRSLAEGRGKSDEKPRDPADIEMIVRLQIFLDQAEFAPGRIDGSLGQFTFKALALYREAQSGQPSPTHERNEAKPDAMPDVSDLHLTKVDPIFVAYTVTGSDLIHIGDLPEDVAEQAKSTAMTYRSVVEAIAEKFHTDVNFLEELNPGRTVSIREGDSLIVPNVMPFELTTVAEGTAKSENSSHDDIRVKIDTGTSMLTVLENKKTIAAYPVTIGSEQNESPIGDWKVTEISGMPNFRYDKSMLQEGVRSDDFYMLPPGPNNPVGVTWIQLNKSGIGMHGTSEPDTIGRSSSHGCVRLANWDIVRLAEKITAGVPVEIH